MLRYFLFVIFTLSISTQIQMDIEPKIDVLFTERHYSKELSSSLEELMKESRRISKLKEILNILRWDQQVNIPKGALEDRGTQLSIVREKIYDLETDKKLGKLIQQIKKLALIDNVQLQPFDAALLRLMEKSYQKQTKISKDLLAEISSLETIAFSTWIEARKTNNYSLMIPYLKKWFEFKKKLGYQINPLKDSYETLLDEYDDGMTVQKLDKIFGDVKKEVLPLIQKVLLASNQKNFISSITENDFPIETQKIVNEKIAKDIGFSFDHGRLDISTHPMCIPISKKDVRITTRYTNSSFLKSLIPTIHEVGHAIYEQNLNEEYSGTKLAEPQGNSFHESQSILWERHIGLSLPFWSNYWSYIQSQFPSIPSNITAEQAYQTINKIKLSYIRVESDELTYVMHIILRYEIEKLLFNGTLEFENLPKIWNDKMKEYLNLEPLTDTLGVLQDIHWSLGFIGYFPSYLSGQILSSQIFNKMKNDLYPIEEKIKQGNFKVIREWLTERIYSKGGLFEFDDFIEEITGEPMNPKYFINYLKEKYSKIYDIQL